MTVVAFDGKVLAADKRTSFGGLHGTTTKVHQTTVGDIDIIMAGTGPSALINEMRQWVADGARPEAFPAAQRDADKNCSLLVVRRKKLYSGGYWTKVEQYEATAYPLVIENKQWAIGSGRDFALMAMHLGKTAAEAVELASLFCSDCGNGVDAIEVTRP